MTAWRGTPVWTLLVLGAWGCGNGEAEEARGLQTAAVERGDLRITAEATGTVEPIRKVEVKSKASGEVLRLHVDVGDAVAPGALLAEVDPRDVRNRHDQAVADLEVAQARADIAKAQLERSNELHASGVITDQELEGARLEFSNAQANLIKARTNTELAELQLEDVTIRAPMAGTILQKSVEEGQVIQSASQNVSGGTTLYMMASLEEMQVRTLVDETDMGEIRSGMAASVKVEAFPEQAFEGTVEKIEPQAVVQQNVTMFPVIVKLDNRQGFLKPGMNAEVEILIDEAHDVLLVPNNAIVLPQDAVPAAMALGLDPERADVAQLSGGANRAGRQGAANGPARGPGARVGGNGSGAEASDAGGASPAAGEARDRQETAAAAAGRQTAATEDALARRDSLRARVERGEISRDSLRSLMRRSRADGGRQGGAAVDRGGVPGRTALAGGQVPAALQAAERQVRRAVVFVVDSAGVPGPRVVQIGLNDWDRTEVLSGLEEGEQLALIGAAQLQAQQQEFLNMIRSRQGSPFGGGGPMQRR